MATIMEIEHCFTDMRRELGALFEARQSDMNTILKQMGPGEDKAEREKEIAEAQQLWRFIQMGLFIGESLIVDFKRIADNSDYETTMRQRGEWKT